MLGKMNLTESQPLALSHTTRSQSGDALGSFVTPTVFMGQQPRPYYTPQTVCPLLL
jgi:hypothetical protein